MSLKIVHVLFILSATALALGFGFWGVREGGTSGNPMNLWLGRGSFVLACGLAIYLVWFLTKMRRLKP